MPNDANQTGILPSVLDRLIDPDSAGTAARLGYSVEQVIDVVRRDLEDLLNTRQSVIDIPKPLQRTRDSIHAYGMRDLTSFTAVTPEQRDEVAQALESSIALYEPRLRDIHATLLTEADDFKQRRLRFRVEARVALDPAPEVTFNTVLELSTGHHTIQSSMK